MCVGQFVNVAGHGGRLGGYRGLTHGELLVECNMSCVGPVCEISQGMEGGWVVIEASHMMGYGLNVTFNMLNLIN